MRSLKERNLSTIVFIGAGASVSAGIPLASGIMNFLENNEPYKTQIDGCTKRSYSEYMNCLSHGERKQLINKYVEQAKINMAHLYLGALVDCGYVDCIVTTNFDPLTLRSLALFNRFPAVYDMTSARSFSAGSIVFPCVVYLHGQANGFMMLNEETEFPQIKETAGDVFNEITKGRSWIVLGYSGDNDPVMETLTETPRFEEGMHWIAYKDAEPNDVLMKKILASREKGASYLKGYDADSFFRALAIELGVADLRILRQPFSHLLSTMENIGDFILDGKPVEMTKEPRERIQGAIDFFESGKGFDSIKSFEPKQVNIDNLVQSLKEIRLNARFEGSEDIYKEAIQSKNATVLAALSDVYNDWAVQLLDGPGENEQKMLAAIDRCKQAISVRENNDLAWYNWSLALARLAELKEGTEKQELFSEALNKCKKTIEVRKENGLAWANWGYIISKLAAEEVGEKKGNLFQEAIDKATMAIQVQPEKQILWINLAFYQEKLSDLKETPERENLLREACENYKQATLISKDSYLAWNNWGITLAKLSDLKDGIEKENILYEAVEKHQQATEVKKDESDSWYNWGRILTTLADLKQGIAREKMINEAIEKCNQSIYLKKDNADALITVGVLLEKLSVFKDSTEKEKLLNESCEKYRQAIECNQNYALAWANMGIVLGKLSEPKEGADKQKLLLESCKKLQRASEINPQDGVAWEEWGRSLHELSFLAEGNQKEKALNEAIQKYLISESINVGNASYNLASCYAQLNEKQKALEYLEQVIDLGKAPSKEDILANIQFENIKDTSEFLKLMESYK